MTAQEQERGSWYGVPKSDTVRNNATHCSSAIHCTACKVHRRNNVNIEASKNVLKPSFCIFSSFNTPSFRRLVLDIQTAVGCEAYFIEQPVDAIIEIYENYKKVLVVGWFHYFWLQSAIQFHVNGLESYIYGALEHIPILSDAYLKYSEEVPYIPCSEAWVELSGLRKLWKNILDAVPHGIDLGFWYQVREKDKVPTLMSVVTGNLPRKGIDVLWKLLKRIYVHGVDCRYIIVMTRDLYEHFGKVLSMFPFVEIYTKVSDEKLRELYSRAHIYVCTSYCEGFYLPSLEACACGCYVIAPALPTIVEYGLAHEIIPVKSTFYLQDNDHKVLYILFDYDENKLISSVFEAIKRFEDLDYYPFHIHFDANIVYKKFLEVIK